MPCHLAELNLLEESLILFWGLLRGFRLESTGICLPLPGIKGVCHHTWLFSFIFRDGWYRPAHRLQLGILFLTLLLSTFKAYFLPNLTIQPPRPIICCKEMVRAATLSGVPDLKTLSFSPLIRCQPRVSVAVTLH